ncbi:hypothetical protein [Argonema galeatum]|uniref:hypothetical protein n=1 Tax=Argonema galeatum TaxID=2942762 RepID=UPI0020114737|nr:hypothetical protein [Argonema galeatum]MCL1466370.1 hypothetical protein [Argonema galeatum A003/A1]
MSEAQNPNGRALRDETDPLDGIESALVEPEADLTDARATSVNQPAESPETDPLLVSESSHEPIDDTITSSPIAEALAWQSDADVVELVSLSEALRQQNTDLIEHTEQMEKLLDECHSALQLQIERSQTAETRFAQQAIELQTTQAQLTRLFREMETSHQVAQRQQILIETLNEQLQSSQERVAQLERQCALTQQRHNEQSQLLLQSETACGELQDRLQRQQRYTLQFKAALDKCLDMPTIKESTATSNIAATTAISQSNPQNILELPRTLFKPQPIQPWSAAPESPEQDIDSDRVSLDVGLPILDEEEYSVQASGFNYETNPKSSYDRDLRDATPLLSKIDADIDVFVNPFLSAAESNLELESDLSAGRTTDSTPNISLAEEDLWQELERLTQDTMLSEKATSPENPVPELAQWQDAIDVAAYKSEDYPAAESELLEPTAFCESGIVRALATDESGSSGQAPNWPSPVVYPQRTPKKIKSLAAIDLPTFPRINKG